MGATAEGANIHVPGTIQPHDVLLALDPHSYQVLQISANAKEVFDVPVEAVLGQPLSTLFGAASDAVRAGLARVHSTAGEPFDVTVRGRAFDARAHRYQDVTILELERRALDASSTDLALRP